MARVKPTPEDVEIEKARLAAETAAKICDTVFRCVLTAAATVCVGIIAWAAVRITDRPAWVTVVLAVIGLGTPPSVVAWRVIVRLKKQVAADLQESQPTGLDAPAPPTNEGEGKE